MTQEISSVSFLAMMSESYWAGCESLIELPVLHSYNYQAKNRLVHIIG